MSKNCKGGAEGYKGTFFTVYHFHLLNVCMVPI